MFYLIAKKLPQRYSIFFTFANIHSKKQNRSFASAAIAHQIIAAKAFDNLQRKKKSSTFALRSNLHIYG
jgi:hypothetical protein